MPTVTRSSGKSRSPRSPNHRDARLLNGWSFALSVLQEPKIAREARWFAAAVGSFVLTIALFVVLAFILRPAEMSSIFHSISGVLRGSASS